MRGNNLMHFPPFESLVQGIKWKILSAVEPMCHTITKTLWKSSEQVIFEIKKLIYLHLMMSKMFTIFICEKQIWKEENWTNSKGIENIN